MTTPHLITFRENIPQPAASNPLHTMVGVATSDHTAWIGTRLDNAQQYLALNPLVVRAEPLATTGDRISLTALEQMLDGATIIDNTELERLRNPNPVDTLRAARQVVIDTDGTMLWIDALSLLANRLEAEHEAAQEKAEQDRMIEVLAENAFEHITDVGFGTLSDSQQEKWREAMRRARTHILAEAVQP